MIFLIRQWWSWCQELQYLIVYTLFLDKIDAQKVLVDRMKGRLRPDSIRSCIYSIMAADMSGA